MKQQILERDAHAFVVLRSGAAADAAELIVHCRRKLEPYTVPARVHVCAPLPKSSLGKVQRHALGGQRAEADAAAP